ncbi:AIM24 family protein [Paracoccus sp. ME4]|uniref:AIM24 family protein n=1 Tax=Paracoccus sp. ME4 TaxID=3138066 RepID=UPI00398BA86C
MDYTVLDQKTTNGGRIEVVEYGPLAGSSDARTAEKLFFLREARMSLKSLRITLNRGRCRIEPGALYHMQGKLEMRTSTGGGLISAVARRVASGESLFVNEVEGSGELLLEPTFGHFILAEIDGDEGLIVDKGMFYAAIGDIDVGVFRNRGTGMAAGEGLFQTKLTGKGLVALYSPVPMTEISEARITPEDPLFVDGNFALMRTTGVAFTLRRSSKSWFSTAQSGEGLLQTFTGSGTVWFAPTQHVYEMLSSPIGLVELSRATGNRSNMVGRAS